MTARRWWTDNKTFQARQWRKIVHILDNINHSWSTIPIQMISGTMGSHTTNRKYIGYNEETFEENNL